MFEGGKGVYAEGFGTLDEHRVLASSDMTMTEFGLKLPECWGRLCFVLVSLLQTCANYSRASVLLNQECRSGMLFATRTSAQPCEVK